MQHGRVVTRGPIGIALAFAAALLPGPLQGIPAGLKAEKGATKERPIRLRTRTFVPAPNIKPRVARSFRMTVAEARPLHYLIQFDAPITEATLEALRAAGAVPLRVVPDNALAIAVPASFEASTIAGARWIGSLLPADKISDIEQKMRTYTAAQAKQEAQGASSPSPGEEEESGE